MSGRYFQNWRDVPPEHRGASVAMGAFDGVHRGHQEVINAARRMAVEKGAPLGIVTFDPHPREFFAPDAEPFRINAVEEQVIAFHRQAVDKVYMLRFDAEMAAMSPEAFVRDVLVGGLGGVHVAAGYDITFGARRSGDAQTLKALGARYGFGVTIVDRADDAAGDKYSSTAVREAVRAGDMARAADILGRPFEMCGVVRHGRGKGRELGFPTANIRLGDKVRPRFGVYAVRVTLEDGREYDAVAYIGAGEAVEAREPMLETWILDFDEDIYDQILGVRFIDFIRPDMRFDSLEALQAQAADDAARARAVLAANA